MADKDSLPPIREKKREDAADGEPTEKWQPHNWAFFKKDERTLRKMAMQQKSKYLAYEDPPKDVAEAQSNSRKRLIELKKKIAKANQMPSMLELDDKDKHEKLIGQLKAAESRNRIRIMRLRYEANKAQEINHLIACQPTARKAVRLQALIPVRPEDRSQGDTLDKISRSRVENLLEDTGGLITGRT